MPSFGPACIFRVLPPVWCNGIALLPSAGMAISRCSQDAAAQQVEFGSSIHGPLQQLQPVDLTLDGAGAPGFDKGSQHRVMVALDAARERVERRLLRVGQLGIQRRPSLLVGCAADQGREAASKFSGLGEIEGCLGQVREERALLRIQLVGRGSQQLYAAPAGRLRSPRRALDFGRLLGRVLPPPSRHPAGDRVHRAGEAQRL